MSQAPTSEPAPMDEARKRRFLRIVRLIMVGTVLTVIALSAVGAEMWARWYERTRNPQPDYFPSIYYPHRRLRYGLVPNTDYYGWFKINSQGFRGREFTREKPPGVFRIICLGGSTTFDIGAIGANKPWPEVLEAELRNRLGSTKIEVLNFGIGGATSLDSLIDLQMRALNYQPDMVIVYQGHNDLVYSIPPSGPTPPSPLYPQEDRTRSSFDRWMSNNSLLYAKTKGRITERIDSVLSVLGKIVTFGTADAGVIQDRDKVMESWFADYRANIISIAAIARANRISLVLPKILIPFPSEKRDGPPCNQCDGLSSLYAGLPLEKLRAMFARYNAVLAQVGEQGDGVHYIQTDGFVPSDDRHYQDPVHFGAEGSRQMGIHLAAALTGLVKLSAP
jgi:lysophospholipase L1-like esterase